MSTADGPSGRVSDGYASCGAHLFRYLHLPLAAALRLPIAVDAPDSMPGAPPHRCEAPRLPAFYILYAEYLMPN